MPTRLEIVLLILPMSLIIMRVSIGFKDRLSINLVTTKNINFKISIKGSRMLERSFITTTEDMNQIRGIRVIHVIHGKRV